MSILSQFVNGDRVCIIGDSITVRSQWIACIAQHYAEKTNEKVDFFPCGVGGGSALAAISYLQQQTAIFNPNIAVVMLGMNDVGHNIYEGSTTKDKIVLREKAFKNYKNNLIVLSNQIETMLGIKKIIYLSPTPYDEEQNSNTPCFKGKSDALLRCGLIMKEVSEMFGGEFYDLGGEMLELLKLSHKNNSPNELISTDRVHPNDMGFSVMARLFLKAQDFDVEYPTVETVCNGKTFWQLSEKAQSFRKAAYDLQWLWTIEWTIMRDAPDKTQNGKFEYAENYNIYKPDADDYFRQLANDYYKFKSSECKLVEDIINANKMLYGESQ